MENAEIPINKEIHDLKDTIKERQTNLKNSKNETFVLSFISTLLFVYSTL